MSNRARPLSLHLLLLPALAVAPAAYAVPALAAPPPLGRALFVRDPATVGSERPATALLELCKTQGVRLVLLSWDSEGPDAKAAVRFLPWAHAQGIQVYALAGRPEWGLPPARPGEPMGRDALNHTLRVIEYNAGAPANERFDGILHDVDVRAAAEYRAGDPKKQQDLLSTSVEILLACQRAVLHGAPELSYGAVIPGDFDERFTSVWVEPTREGEQTRTVEAPAFEQLLRCVRLGVILTTAASPPEAILAAQEKVRCAARLQRHFYVGLRLAAPVGVTGDGAGPMTRSDAEGVLGALGLAFATDQLYRGVALDGYEQSLKLPP